MSCCSALRITAEEEDISSVSRGQKVLVHADAFPGRIFEGRVTEIRPKGGPVARSFRVRISLPQDTPLMIGVIADTNNPPSWCRAMPLGLRIALVHLTHRHRQTVTSLLGITLGVAFFMAVSARMRGSEQDFIDRLIDAAPHITVSDKYRMPPEQRVVTSHAGGTIRLPGLKPKIETRGIRG
jgi:hypothetical protein